MVLYGPEPEDANKVNEGSAPVPAYSEAVKSAEALKCK
jgi:hypothetical protein